MVIASTPLRISFFGGGTDYPVWFRQHGGSVLSTTIDKCWFGQPQPPTNYADWCSREYLDSSAPVVCTSRFQNRLQSHGPNRRGRAACRSTPLFPLWYLPARKPHRLRLPVSRSGTTKPARRSGK